jgi:hypothetical protein
MDDSRGRGGAGQCQFFGVDLGLVLEVGAGLAGLDTRMAT